MSIASRSGGQATCSTRPECRRGHDRLGDRAAAREALVVADVEHLSWRVGRERRKKQALDDVVDVEAVALLLAVAEHRDGLVGERAPDEDRQEPLEVVTQALTGTEHVREPHRGRGQPVDLVVEEVELLGRRTS